MSTRDSLRKMLESLPEQRLSQLLEYAQFLSFKHEQEEWQRAGQAHFAKCYGPDEPDYSDAPAIEEISQ